MSVVHELEVLVLAIHMIREMLREARADEPYFRDSLALVAMSSVKKRLRRERRHSALAELLVDNCMAACREAYGLGGEGSRKALGLAEAAATIVSGGAAMLEEQYDPEHTPPGWRPGLGGSGERRPDGTLR